MIRFSALFSTLLLSGSVALFSSQAASADQSVSFTSGEGRVELIELYTSEGCSSCPPADKWMSNQVQDHDLWRTHIPVAFHVDYWDYIGWKDPFGDKAYTKRQHGHAQRLGMRTVYTPGVFVNGAEQRRWRTYRAASQPEDMPGALSVTVDGNEVSASFKPSEGTQPPEILDITVAVLGFDIVTDVTRGENAGKSLEHDFVVLGLTRMRLEHNDGTYTSSFNLPKLSVMAPKLGVAAWISDSREIVPLQATGGYLSASN